VLQPFAFEKAILPWLFLLCWPKSGHHTFGEKLAHHSLLRAIWQLLKSDDLRPLQFVPFYSGLTLVLKLPMAMEVAWAELHLDTMHF
jgi:hypothetical protein